MVLLPAWVGPGAKTMSQGVSLGFSYGALFCVGAILEEAFPFGDKTAANSLGLP